MQSRFQFRCCGPALTHDDIVAFERELNGQLSQDYREFLLAYNGGIMEPSAGFRWRGEFETILRLRRLDPNPNLFLRLAARFLWELNPVATDGFLPIAETTSMDDICLAYRGTPGAIYITDFQYERADNGDLLKKDVAMVPLAASFTAFMDSLVLIPTVFCPIVTMGREGTADELRDYLAEGGSINAVGKNGSTILCEAIIDPCVANEPAILGATSDYRLLPILSYAASCRLVH